MASDQIFVIVPDVQYCCHYLHKKQNPDEGYSFVYKQPENEEEEKLCQQALEECPVEAIFPEDALPEKWEPFVKINLITPSEFVGTLMELAQGLQF